MEYAWPGNIRELRNVTRVGCALQKEGIIHPKDFPQNYPFLKSIVLPVSQQEKQVSSLSQQSRTPLFSPSLTLEEHEKRIYAKAYDYFSRQPKKTYEALGVSNATFFKKLKEWDLKNPDSPLFQENFTYNPSLTLRKHLDKILSEAYEHYDHQPYHVIKKLKISPGYFYKWKKSGI